MHGDGTPARRTQRHHILRMEHVQLQFATRPGQFDSQAPQRSGLGHPDALDIGFRKTWQSRQFFRLVEQEDEVHVGAQPCQFSIEADEVAT